jgi:hypothetical protein
MELNGIQIWDGFQLHGIQFQLTTHFVHKRNSSNKEHANWTGAAITANGASGTNVPQLMAMFWHARTTHQLKATKHENDTRIATIVKLVTNAGKLKNALFQHVPAGPNGAAGPNAPVTVEKLEPKLEPEHVVVAQILAQSFAHVMVTQLWDIFLTPLELIDAALADNVTAFMDGDWETGIVTPRTVITMKMTLDTSS